MDGQPVELDLSSNDDPTPTDLHGISEERIRTMVEKFYARTQQDDLLGPIFELRVSDWEAHYEKMTRFWASATLRAGTYSGRPIEAHRFDGFTKEQFDRWVELFTKTASEVFPVDGAEIMCDLAKKMASSIAMRIGVGRIHYA